MSFGLDYVTGPPIAEMKAAGVTFVCRYLSEVNPATQVKLLTLAEAKMLGAAGMKIVSNYEWYGNRAAEGFASGVVDAQIAASQHTACGGPVNKPIYFSVDFNTGATPAIIAYFHGVASVIGLSRTGAYGGYSLIKGLFDAGVIAWGWQTYAWSGGLWEPRAHIYQYSNGMSMAGLSVDYDRSIKPDFGQWIEGGSMIPPNWHDDGHTLIAPNGHKIVMGFRDHVLNYPGGWPTDDQPLEEEWHADPLELSNLALGAGQKQCFTWTTLEWTPSRGVFEAYQGQEIVALRAAIASLKASQTFPDAVGALTQAHAAYGAVAEVIKDLGGTP